MPFDAMFLTAVAAELRPALVGARVDKIQQPARDTVVLQLRGRDGGGRLLLSANGNRPRVHLTQAQLENPRAAADVLYAAARSIWRAAGLPISASPRPSACST